MAERLHVVVSPESEGTPPYDIADRAVIRRLAGLMDADAPARRLGGALSIADTVWVCGYEHAADAEPRLSVTVTTKSLLFDDEANGYEAELPSGELHRRIVRKDFDFPANPEPRAEAKTGS